MTDQKRKLTKEQRREAMIALGFRDERYRPIPFEDRDPDALLDTVIALRHRLTARAGANHEEIAILERKMRNMRKAKRLANARADRAEKAMRSMLDSLREEIKSDK